jgi:hypothetical protein
MRLSGIEVVDSEWEIHQKAGKCVYFMFLHEKVVVSSPACLFLQPLKYHWTFLSPGDLIGHPHHICKTSDLCYHKPYLCAVSCASTLDTTRSY